MRYTPDASLFFTLAFTAIFIKLIVLSEPNYSVCKYVYILAEVTSKSYCIPSNILLKAPEPK